MVFASILDSVSQVKKAGETLRMASSSSEEYQIALHILLNFRSIHTYPLNSFQATLRKRLRKISKTAIIAQRIKRLPTILDKLQRYPTMQLSRMQDIGGLRAIVNTPAELDKIYSCYKNAPHFPHQLAEEKDYIHQPKISGYRGKHLIYKNVNKSLPEYNGLRIEIQLRTKLQHIWATAVETFESFLGEQFKSSKGDNAILDFFGLSSSCFALLENLPVLPEHKDKTPEAILSETCKKINELNIIDKIQRCTLITKHIVKQNKHKIGFGVLTLDTKAKSVQYLPYTKEQYETAYEQYTEKENLYQNHPEKQVVLVKTDSIQQLKRAYPNYFADLKDFGATLNIILNK